MDNGDHNFPKKPAEEPALKVAYERLRVLQLAEELGNVSDACRQAEMDRTSFYEWRRRYREHGLEGLKDLPPVHKSHPQTTPQQVVQRLISVALEHPDWGCATMADFLEKENLEISSPTVQNILIKHEMGTRAQRLLKLEEKALTNGTPLRTDQIEAIERANPCFRERHNESSRPGERLCQDTLLAGQFRGVGSLYIYLAVDTYSSFVFGLLAANRQSSHAADLVQEHAIPFFAYRSLKIGEILTQNRREFYGIEAEPYRQCLAGGGIEHRVAPIEYPHPHGFIERFQQTVEHEFLRAALRATFYRSLEHLHHDFNVWLHHYNFERHHHGYRNMGKRPIERIDDYAAHVRREG
jgi:transposase InsO family protein/transposase-like protein